MGTRIFTAAELHVLGVPLDLSRQTVAADFHVLNGRESERRRCVFADRDAYWAVDYDRPFTERQGVVDHGWGSTVEATEVVPVRIPTRAWVPVGAGVEADPAVDVWIVEVLHSAGRFRFSYRDDEYDLAQDRLRERRERHPDAEVRLVRMTTTYTVVEVDERPGKAPS
ncbi:hypothetical protein [Streptomyces scabiei]|uniref:hypothetical protein n=1 Tax=Streptomyces scabiei TaxID=1930 RepID=UPI000765D8B8|nr:hypothetical protein [Streptomyces scabiei]